MGLEIPLSVDRADRGNSAEASDDPGANGRTEKVTMDHGCIDSSCDGDSSRKPRHVERAALRQFNDLDAFLIQLVAEPA
jgi:hypothetical protein